jgi:hypothetical protein
VPERGIPLFEKRISAPEKALGEQLFEVYIYYYKRDKQ